MPPDALRASGKETSGSHPVPVPMSGYLRKEQRMKELELKYGCNPNQKPARVSMKEGELPFQVLNGRPGYINLMDAMNSWQLVRELKEATGLPAAASLQARQSGRCCRIGAAERGGEADLLCGRGSADADVDCIYPRERLRPYVILWRFCRSV